MIKWLKRYWKQTVAFIAILLIIFSGLVIYIFWFPNTLGNAKGRVVTIPRGASFKTVVDSLSASGAIRSTWAFHLAGRYMGYTKSVKVGKYLFVSGLSNLSILEDISEGKSRIIIPVTIPEGWRMNRILRRFVRELGVDSAKLFSLCTDEHFLRTYGIQEKNAEGYLLPETYSFYWQTEEKEILNRILQNFTEFYHDSLKRKQESLGMTKQEVLTLASIVEAETSIPEERPLVAGVYWNRLNKRMKLQADPTVQYTLGEMRRLTFNDLMVNSPYNTYRNVGLPPGPINNPGKSSIIASLYPEKHSYVFFVAKGTGGHNFAKSFSDHQKNIQQYRRTRRQMQQQNQMSHQ